MARHGEILDSFKQKVENFDFTNEEHVTCVSTEFMLSLWLQLIIAQLFMVQCSWGRLWMYCTATLSRIKHLLKKTEWIIMYSPSWIMTVSCFCACQLKMVLIKCCDISNEVRPMEVAEPWVDCLLEEYFMQVIELKKIWKYPSSIHE